MSSMKSQSYSQFSGKEDVKSPNQPNYAKPIEIQNGKGTDSKRAFEGIDGKPFLFQYTSSKEAGIHNIFLTAIHI